MADVLAAIAALPDPILRIKAERSVAAIAQTLDPAQNLAAQLLAALAQPPARDERDNLGAARGGRPKAAGIIRRVQTQLAAP